MKKLSFILPSRDNLKYLKWAYAAIRKNASPEHEICMYDDFSSDGTWDWMQERSSAKFPQRSRVAGAARISMQRPEERIHRASPGPSPGSGKSSKRQ